MAVCPDASVIDDTTMQRIAMESNFPETAFVVPATRSDSAVGVRIFTPAREILFAGHITVATAFVVMDEGIVPKDRDRFVLDERIGPAPIRAETGERSLMWLRTPPISLGRGDDRDACAQAGGLGLQDSMDAALWVVTPGHPSLSVALRDEHAVDRASLDMRTLRCVEAGLVGHVRQ